MPIRRPSAKIEIDGRRLSAAEAGLAWLRIDLSHGAHDAAMLAFWTRSKFAGVQAGAKASIALGAADSEEDVWAGEIAVAHAGAASVLLEGLAPTAGLSRSRRSQTYQNQSVAAIVRDLAGNVEVDQVQADVELESYSIDTRRPVWFWLLDLARLTGSSVGSSASGALRFVPAAAGGASHTFRYGAELLAWKIGHLPKSEPLKVAAHGAGSDAGSDKWHWILHDPVGAGGDPTRIVPSFHTRDQADNLSKALDAQAESATIHAELTVVGEPAVRPGDSVTLQDLPDDPGHLRVRQVHHVLDSARGFVTHLTVEGAGSGGGLV